MTSKSPGIYQSHDTSDCFDIFPEKRRAAGVRILSVPVHVNDDDEFDPEEAAAFIEAYKLNQGLSCLAQSGSDQKESVSDQQ